MKGVSNAVIVLGILIVAVVAIGVTAIYYTQYAAMMAGAAIVEYTGEFDDGFLATESYFQSDVTEAIDCNITSDVLGWKENASCVYETSLLWNSSAFSKDWYFPITVDIDGPVGYLQVDFALLNKDTLQAKDDAAIVDAKLYTHEENPRMVFDFNPYIDDQDEIDAKTGPLPGDEYVLYIKLRTGVIAPLAVGSDKIGLLNLKLDTDGDVDEAYITLLTAAS